MFKQSGIMAVFINVKAINTKLLKICNFILDLLKYQTNCDFYMWNIMRMGQLRMRIVHGAGTGEKEKLRRIG